MRIGVSQNSHRLVPLDWHQFYDCFERPQSGLLPLTAGLPLLTLDEAAIDVIVALRDGCSPSWSTTIPTARAPGPQQKTCCWFVVMEHTGLTISAHHPSCLEMAQGGRPGRRSYQYLAMLSRDRDERPIGEASAAHTTSPSRSDRTANVRNLTDRIEATSLEQRFLLGRSGSSAIGSDLLVQALGRMR